MVMDWLNKMAESSPWRGFVTVQCEFLMQMEKAMDDAGMTQTALAAKAGLSRSTVTRMLTDGTDPKLSTLVRVANALDMKLVVRLEPRDDDTKEADPC